MGNSNSALTTCLLAAVNYNPTLVSTPQQPLYQLLNVRPYNMDRPVTPAAVTYPQSAQQVANIVKCAAQNNLHVQPRGGGHSYANYCLGGVNGHVVVDLSNLKQFTYDISTQRAKVGGGILLGEIDKQLNPFKRAMPHGTCPQVGIGGHATIGGLGPSSRMWGSALDQIVSATVVLANGTIVKTSATQYPDVLFAIKGAGAGFGIVTEFEVKTYPQPGQLVQYEYGFNWGGATDLADTFTRWQNFITDPNLDRRFASQFIATPAGAIVSGTFFGTQQEYRKLNVASIFPDKKNDTEIVFSDWLGAAAHWGEELALQAGGLQSSFYSQNLPFKTGVTVPQAGVKKLFDFLKTANADTPIWVVIFDLEGGAINDPPTSSSAYSLRDVTFYMQSYAVGLLGLSETSKQFIRGITNTIQASLPGVAFQRYPGYVDPELGSNAQALYWGSNLPRLQQIKRQIDPNDIFSNPQSVRPA